jgi:glutaredoxin
LKKVRIVRVFKKNTRLLDAREAEYSPLLALVFFLKYYLLLVFLFFTIPTSYAIETQINVVEKPFLEVFVRDGCPHCTEAKKFLPILAKQYPKLRIVIHSIDKDSVAREDLISRSKKAGVWPPGVPAFIFADRIHVGFKSAEDTGPELVALFSREVSSKIKRVTPQPQTTIDSQMLGNISVERFGLPVFTLVIGLLDGFNPCAMWVLLFLLSLLVHLHDRKKMAMIAGTFVIVSGLVYYVFIAAWLNLFMYIGISTKVVRMLGGVALFISCINIREFFSQGTKFTLSIPERAKPGLYSQMRKVMNAHALWFSLLGVIVLAIVVNFIELLCTAGFPALYTAILTQQELSMPMYYGYIGLYIIGYITDDAIAVSFAVMALSSQKLSIEAGQRLKLISGSVMFILGLVMLFRPSWLS